MNSQLFLDLKRACAAVTKVASAEAQRKAGVFGAQAQALLVLTSIGQCTSSELARQLDLGKSGISTLVDRLKALEMISARPDPCDGRSILLELTVKGRETSGKVSQLIEQIDLQLAQGLGAAELEIVEKFLKNAGKITFKN